MSEEIADFSPEETARRRDAVLKRMLNTPPQPRATPSRSPLKSRKKTESDQQVPGSDADPAS